MNALDRDAIFDAIADGPVPIAEIPVQEDDDEEEQDEDEERETPGAKAQARQQPSREGGGGGGGGSWWSWTRKWLTCVHPCRRRAVALALKGLGALACAGSYAKALSASAPQSCAEAFCFRLFHSHGTHVGWGQGVCWFARERLSRGGGRNKPKFN